MNEKPRFLHWILYTIFGFILRRVTYKLDDLEKTTGLLQDGVVVHIFEFASLLDSLTLIAFLKYHNLPLPVIIEPPFWVRWGRGLLRMAQSLAGMTPSPLEPMPPTDKPGEHYIIFLKRRRSLFEHGAPLSAQLQIQEMVKRQEVQDVPIYLVPHILFWNNLPPVAGKRKWLELAFGNNLNPGRLRKMVIFLGNIHRAFASTGAPVDLQRVVAESETDDHAALAQQVRMDVYRFFADERAAVSGPMMRPRSYLLESILRSGEVSEAIQRKATEENRPIDEVRNEAARILDKLASDYSPSGVAFLEIILRYTFPRIYREILITDEDLERLKEILRDGPVVFGPGHKSHVDYWMLSFMLVTNHIPAPLIVAGDNLSFWPMGYIFRRAGAFFIRRSIRGDWLYTTILKAYIKKMFWEGYSHEFFIEGGRSRTGRLLLPKFGILSMYVDAFLDTPERDLRFVPLSISYERLVEEGSYERELKGAKKRKESFRSLLGIRKVLKSKYGNVYMRFGTPISLQQMLRNQGEDPVAGFVPTPSQRRQLTQDLGFEIISKINAATTTTTQSIVALALLSHGRKGATLTELKNWIDLILEHLRENDAHISLKVEDPGWSVTDTLEYLEREKMVISESFADETIYVLQETGRLRLAFYANTILHNFFRLSIVATAFLSFKSDRVNNTVLEQRAKYLTDILRHEFVFGKVSDYGQLYASIMEYLEQHQALVRDGESFVQIGAKADVLTFLAGMIWPLLESYWLCARAMPVLLNGAKPEKEFIREVMQRSRKLHLLGDTHHFEALNQVNFKNAVKYFERRGVLMREAMFESTQVEKLPPAILGNPKKMKKVSKKTVMMLSLYEEYLSAEKLTVLADELGKFLSR